MPVKVAIDIANAEQATRRRQAAERVLVALDQSGYPVHVTERDAALAELIEARAAERRAWTSEA